MKDVVGDGPEQSGEESAEDDGDCEPECAHLGIAEGIAIFGGVVDGVEFVGHGAIITMGERDSAFFP